MTRRFSGLRSDEVTALHDACVHTMAYLRPLPFSWIPEKRNTLKLLADELHNERIIRDDMMSESQEKGE